MSSGRIRSIKPEILDDAVTAGLSDSAFRLFIAIIVLADDYGRLRAEPGWLRGQVFWNRDINPANFSKALDELVPLVTFYTVDGQRYAEIRNWGKHQRVDKPGKPKVPPNPGHSRESRETPARVSGGCRESLAPDLDMDMEGDQEREQEQEPKPTAARDERPDEVWEHYVATLKRYRPRRRPTVLGPKDRKGIRDLLRSGLTVSDLKAAVNGMFKSPWHMGISSGTEYLEIKYAIKNATQFMALADEGEPPAPKPDPDEVVEYVDPALIDAELEKLDRRFAS